MLNIPGCFNNCFKAYCLWGENFHDSITLGVGLNLGPDKKQAKLIGGLGGR